ncbi:hypothetical protein TNCV_4802331 [Trichonephila clavipes]|nr:hypothetical protein TNCV_4802331 [Trichonephila clavipes]
MAAPVSCFRIGETCSTEYNPGCSSSRMSKLDLFVMTIEVMSRRRMGTGNRMVSENLGSPSSTPMVLSKTPWIRHIIQGFQIISNGILTIFDWSPEPTLQCLGFSCEEASAPPPVLRLCTDLWTHGSGLVSLDQMGISLTTTTCTVKKINSINISFRNLVLF